MSVLYPLRFRPILRQYIWGGRRLETVLGKRLGPGRTCAESWEICDLGEEQSVVVAGPLAGATLGELVAERGPGLLGRHHPLPRFPLLLKFLDAAQTLSVQVHPDDALAARLNAAAVGKTEAWVVLVADPGALIYAGLRPGIDRPRLAAALRQGTCEACLHAFHPRPGDCVFLPAGTVHALGAGLLVAEIQQPSDVTYRLFDWNRVGLDGKPRPLHVELGLEAIHFDFGPVMPQQARATDRPGVTRLVECDKFVLDRWEIEAPQTAGGDQRFHVITVLEGSLQIVGDPDLAVLPRGTTVLLPAALGEVRVVPLEPTVALDAYLP